MNETGETKTAIEYSIAPSRKKDVPFSLRAATASDLPMIVAIDRASFTQPWSPRSFEHSLSDAKTIFIVAQCKSYKNGNRVLDNQCSDIAGYGVAYTVTDEGEIATLAVADRWRGRGVGEALVRSLCETCAIRGARQLFLEVRAGNTTAQRLYERCSFTAVGTRPHYYADGEDAVIMRKFLDDVTHDSGAVCISN